MRIAHVLSPWPNGRALDDGLRLAQAFADLGHEVVVLTTSPTPVAGQNGLDVRSISPDRFDARAIDLLDSAATGAPEFVPAVRAIVEGATLRQQAPAALAGFTPDLVYEASAPFVAAGGPLAHEYGVSVVVEASEDGAAGPLRAAAEELERIALESAHHVVTTSDRGRDRLTAAGVPERKLAVLPPAIDADGYELTAPVRDALRSLLGVADRQTVGVIADLTPERDLATVFEATTELHRRGAAVTLLLVGDGSERPFALETAERSDEVTALLPGAVPEDQIPAYLAAIDVAVAPSAPGAEFPLRHLFQYLAAGVPVVAADSPGIEHCIRGGETGLTYPPGDARALADALGGLLQDRDHARAVGTAGHKHIAKKHSWTARAKSILALTSLTTDHTPAPADHVPAPNPFRATQSVAYTTE